MQDDIIGCDIEPAPGRESVSECAATCNVEETVFTEVLLQRREDS